jgi:hypothetical protein
MFSISTAIRRKWLPNNELELLDDSDKNKYDLYNENYYDIYGNVVKEASEYIYKGKFILLLELNRYEISQILDYHFSKSVNRDLFYNFVKVDLSVNSTLDVGIVNVIKEWLDKVNEVPKFEIEKKTKDIYIKEQDISNLYKIEKGLRVYLDNDFMDEQTYNKLVKALLYYFENESCSSEMTEIFIKDIPMRELGWVLGRIHWDVKNIGFGLPYLKFAKQYISIFKSAELDEKEFRKCNLYKYFTGIPKVFKASTKNTKNTF